MSSTRVIVEADGGSRGNPGPAGYGAVVFDADDRSVLAERMEDLGIATNNVAEYTALLKALAAAAELKATDIQIFSDSELLVRQMNGQYRVKNAGLLELFIKAKDMASGFESCTISHVRREMNSHADRMVNLALDREHTTQVLDDARRVLSDLGAKLAEISMPSKTTAMYKDWAKFCAVETAVAHEQYYPARKAEYGPVLADLIELGRGLGPLELMHVFHDRLVFIGELRKLFKEIDLLLVPVHPFGNPSADDLDRIFKTPNGIDDVLRFTAPFDMSGSPTITIPGGFTPDNLPVGFQLVGRHLDEALLVRAAHAYQGATDWHRRHPTL